MGRRAIAFAPYADCIWMETGKPILSQATQFAKEVRAAWPHQMLAYNLSPSFNWDAAGMTDAQMESFVWDLAKMGFCWQFITLAGFHCNALSIDLFARDYAKRGALAYVEMIQRQERKHGVETLTHQKWSGADYKWLNINWYYECRCHREAVLVLAEERLRICLDILRSAETTAREAATLQEFRRNRPEGGRHVLA